MNSLLLITRENKSESAGLVNVKRDPCTRKKWIEFWDNGERLARVAFSDATCYAVLLERPSESKGTLSLKLGLFKVAEVWSGLDGRLSSMFIGFNGVNYYGSAINGWRFFESDISYPYQSSLPSDAAEQIALEFLIKICGNPT